MAALKDIRTVHQSGDSTLLANGSSGPWEIAIDQTSAGADRLWAQIEGPSISFSFAIPSFDVVGKMIEFLAPTRPLLKGSSNNSGQRAGELAIGHDTNTPVVLLTDDEYDDRYFLVIGPTTRPLDRFVVAGAERMSTAAALPP